MSIAAIIVNYHTGAFLPRLIERLAPESEIDAIQVVDNSPGDPRVGALAAHPKVSVLAQPRNLGFGRAVNLAAARLSQPWWLVINPDAWPLPGCIPALLEAARRHDAIVAGPRAYWDDECHWRLPPATGDSRRLLYSHAAAAASPLDALLASFDFCLRQECFWSRSEPFAEPFLSGQCLLIKNLPECFPGGHIFDERFFLYYEDTDLCAHLLLRRQLLLCVPAARIVHYWDQAPTTHKAGHMQNAALAYFEKHYGAMPPRTSDGPRFDGEGQFEDLGVIEHVEQLNHLLSHWAPRDRDRPVYVELGLNPWLVPFIQRDAGASATWFTPEHWRRIRPGAFFCRLRAADSPYPIRQWRWRKPATPRDQSTARDTP